MDTRTRLSRRAIARYGAAGAGAAIATHALGGTILAQDDATPVGSPEMGLPPLPANAFIVVEGLNNPRNLAWGADGTLYISEQGTGGDEVLALTPPGSEGEATPVAGEAEATPVEEAGPPSTRGYTGNIVAVAPDGTSSVVLSGLASYSDGAGVVGLAAAEGGLYYTIGGVAVGFGLPDPLPEENTVNWLDLATGESTELCNVTDFEVEENPDGSDVNPNLYDIDTLSDGTVVFTDAGGNVIYTLDAETGEFEPLAILPLQGELPGASADPAGAERQVVPTSVVVNSDDSLVVSLLSEFWPADAPSIIGIDAEGTVSPIAPGLSTIVNLAVGPDGQLYASSLSSDISTGAPGSVLRILADGTTETVVEGLAFPHGIEFDADGNLYVVVYALIPGAGTVARIDGVATPA
jgi:sugar lactone lactonase YvrE